MIYTGFGGWEKPPFIILIETGFNHRNFNNDDIINTAVVLRPNNRRKIDELQAMIGGRGSKVCELTGKVIHTKELLKEHLYENKGIKVNIAPLVGGEYMSANNNSCIIEMSDGKKFLIELDIYNKMQIVSQLNVNKGKVTVPMEFAFNQLAVNLVHRNMVTYANIVKDTKYRELHKRGKTDKYKPGYRYTSLTESMIYIGEIYRCGEVSIMHSDRLPEEDRKYEITLYNKPKKLYVNVQSYAVNNNDKVMDFKDYLDGQLDALSNDLKLINGIEYSYLSFYSELDFFSHYKGITKKLYPKIQWEKKINIVNYTKTLGDFLNKHREMLFNIKVKSIEVNKYCGDLLYNSECINIFDNEDIFNKIYELCNINIPFIVKDENGNIIYRR